MRYKKDEKIEAWVYSILLLVAIFFFVKYGRG